MVLSVYDTGAIWCLGTKKRYLSSNFIKNMVLRSCPIDYLCVVYTFGFSSSHRGGPRGPLLDITNFISVKVQTKRQWGTVIYIFSYVLHKFNSCLGATLRERYVLFNCRTTALWICEILLITSQKISLVRSTKPLRHNGQSFAKLLL